MLNKQQKVYSKQSTLPNSGKGLFAKVPIKKGSIIIEFKGTLRVPGENLNSMRSNIYFNDEYILECDSNDLASYCNDGINFHTQPRKLIEALKSNKPFYEKHSMATINAKISLNETHRASLVSTEDIDVGEEIFCHYGFEYWFKMEMIKVGFLLEEEIEQNGFPEKIFEYPAFTSYVHEFYPDNTGIEIKPYKDFYDVVIDFPNDRSLVMAMTNHSKYVRKGTPDMLADNLKVLNLSI